MRLPLFSPPLLPHADVARILLSLQGESITLMAGEDASEDFLAIHSPQGRAMLVEYVFVLTCRSAR